MGKKSAGRACPNGASCAGITGGCRPLDRRDGTNRRNLCLCRGDPNYHKGAADMYRLLDSTPFGRESRETIDKTRTMQDSVKVYVQYLNVD